MTRRILSVFLVLVVRSGVLFGQVASMPYTSLARPLTAEQTNGTPRNVFLLDPTIVGGSNITVNQSTGLPGGSNGAFLFMDQEAMKVQSISNGVVYVERGAQGTRSAAHGALAKVWVASARYFAIQEPMGICNPAVQLVTPSVVIRSGNVYRCQGDGTWGGSPISWNQAQFRWNGTVQGAWNIVPTVQGTWDQGVIPWGTSQFSWSQIAK